MNEQNKTKRIKQPAPVVNNTMLDIANVAEMFKRQEESGIYDIEFPSIGQTYKFKQLTVAQQRLLSKQSADFENRADLIIQRCGLLKAICLDNNFEPLDITWSEFVYALATVRDNNFIDELNFNATCENDKCATKSFPAAIDFSSLVNDMHEVIKKQADKSPKFEFTIGDNNICFNLKFPTVRSYIAFAKTVKGEKDNADITSFLYQYIASIEINGQEVNLAPIRYDVAQFTNFIDTAFTGMSYQKFALTVGEAFAEETSKFTEIQVTCPNCRTTRAISFDIDDFFTL